MTEVWVSLSLGAERQVAMFVIIAIFYLIDVTTKEEYLKNLAKPLYVL